MEQIWVNKISRRPSNKFKGLYGCHSAHDCQLDDIKLYFVFEKKKHISENKR